MSAPGPTRLADLNVAVTEQTNFLLSWPRCSPLDAASFLHRPRHPPHLTHRSRTAHPGCRAHATAPRGSPTPPPSSASTDSWPSLLAAEPVRPFAAGSIHSDPTLPRVVFARCPQRTRHSPHHLCRHRADDREGPGAQRRGGVHRRPAAAGARRSRARAQCACIIVSDSCHRAVRCRKSAPGLISLVRSRSVGAASFRSRATSPRANPCRRSRRRSARSTAT